MPVVPTYPGVYIEELPGGARTITGVATSVTAFVGYARRGPIDSAIKVRNFGDFQREFGGLDAQSAMSYAVDQYFQNGGSEAWIVRVTNSGETNGGKKSKGDLTYDTNKNSLDVEARSKGEWGNHLRVTVDYESANPDSQFNLTVAEYEAAKDDSQEVRSEVFRNLEMNENSARYVVEVVNDRSKLISLEMDSIALDEITDSDKGTSKSGNLEGFDMSLLDDSYRKIAVIINGSERHEIELFSSGSPLSTLDAVANAIQVKVQAELDVPAFNDFKCEYASGRITATSGEGGKDSAVRFLDAADSNAANILKLGIRNGGVEVDAVAEIRPDAKTFAFLTGGTDGQPPDPIDLIGSETDRTGLFALDDVDLLNLLCIPGESDFVLLSKAREYCEKRRAFLLVDPPSNTPQGVSQWIKDNASLRHRNVAVFFPHINAPDPLKENRSCPMPPSGALAGVFARTDAERGVWKAPAGIDASIRGARGLEYTLTDGENGDLNQIGINCLRTFPVYGTVVWGARTLRGADALADTDWKYVPVRRLTLFIEESLYRGTQWVVFEPNDEPLWAQIRLNIGAFMQNLFRQSAFQGTSPRQAYFVKCDKETTTQNDINRGIVNIVVGFAPLKPAEFVMIKIQQMAGQIES